MSQKAWTWRSAPATTVFSKMPLVWRILTTLPVEIADDAKEVVRFYRLRWRIEEVFRALKSDGLALEDTQVQDSARLDTLLLNPPLRHSRKRPSRSVNPLAFMGRENGKCRA
jgi:hypothetical protein